MLKKIGFYSLIITLSITLFLPASAQTNLKVYVNGAETSISAVNHNGIYYIPAQSLAMPLGISIKWDAPTQSLYVNEKKLDCKTEMISGIVHVPIETLAYSLGANLEWDGANNIVKIISSNNNTIPQPPPVTPPPTVPPTPAAIIQPTPVPTQNVAANSIFIPKSVSNDNFTVTVTNLQYQNILKNYYTPKAGFRFCIINVSQQNISPNVQIYTGTFSLFDSDGHSFDYLEGLSNFWLQVLQPGGTNFGHLVYEIPADSIPEKLVLYSVNNPTLNIDLF